MPGHDLEPTKSLSAAQSSPPFASLQPPAPSLFRAAWAVFRKDVRAELRTRYALNAVALFAVSTVVALSLGLGPLTKSGDLPLIHAALLWVAILFAAFTGL